MRAPDDLLLLTGPISLLITLLKKYFRKKSSTFFVCMFMTRKEAIEANIAMGMSALATYTYRVVYSVDEEYHDHVDGEEEGHEGLLLVIEAESLLDDEYEETGVATVVEIRHHAIGNHEGGKARIRPGGARRDLESEHGLECASDGIEDCEGVSDAIVPCFQNPVFSTNLPHCHGVNGCEVDHHRGEYLHSVLKRLVLDDDPVLSLQEVVGPVEDAEGVWVQAEEGHRVVCYSGEDQDQCCKTHRSELQD